MVEKHQEKNIFFNTWKWYEKWYEVRWLDGISDAMDMNVGKLWEVVRDGEAWHAAVHGVSTSLTRLSDWTKTTVFFFCFVFWKTTVLLAPSHSHSVTNYPGWWCSWVVATHLQPTYLKCLSNYLALHRWSLLTLFQTHQASHFSRPIESFYEVN